MRAIFGVFTFALLVALVALVAPPQTSAGGMEGTAGATDATRGVADLLARSAQAWNHPDLATFMRSYADAPDTVYISAKTVIRGYAAIRAHYASRYGRSGMGVLTFSNLSVRPLGGDYAVAVARWHLALPGGARPTGLFSLVLQRSSGGWHIITDHSP